MKERFESPERRHGATHPHHGGRRRGRRAAQKKARRSDGQAKAGADFAHLAKANSKDPASAEQGGDLGWAQRGMFVGPFEEALFA